MKRSHMVQPAQPTRLRQLEGAPIGSRRWLARARWAAVPVWLTSLLILGGCSSKASAESARNDKVGDLACGSPEAFAQWPIQADPGFSSDGIVVTDPTTHLVWRATPDPSYYTWSQAHDACAALAASKFAGHADWRLPTAPELLTLLEPDRWVNDLSDRPLLDQSVFADAQGRAYWTSSEIFPGKRNWVGFLQGGESYEAQNSAVTYGVRCVAGGPAKTATCQYSADQSTVKDNGTGLIWQRHVDFDTLDWNKAKAYCSNLSLGGVSGWRLPTYKELLTLVDFRTHSAPLTLSSSMIDSDAFPRTSPDHFWSSDGVDRSEYAWFVDFSLGEGTGGLNAPPLGLLPYFVRCVR